ncbi:MAG: hypothetical protein AAB397_03040 [Patescibacteria group bacterium]
MFQIIYGVNFLKSVEKLPKKTQIKLANLLCILRSKPFDNRLHTKNLSGQLLGLLSFRITRDWRVIFQFSGVETINLLRVANRKDIYKK